jgi:hypothetical protein
LAGKDSIAELEDLTDILATAVCGILDLDALQRKTVASLALRPRGPLSTLHRIQNTAH